MKKTGPFVVALDAGGTMTDTILLDNNGSFTVGKALTNRAHEAESFAESVTDAASYWDLTLEQTLGETAELAYAGTAMLNALLTRSGRKIGLIITKGFEDYPAMQRGLVWLGQSYVDKLHQATRWPEKPLLSRDMIRGVTERTDQLGQAVIPLYEADVESGAAELIDEGAEALVVCFLWGHINPAHERRAGEIIQCLNAERGIEIPVFLSGEVCPSTREASRLNSCLLEAYAADPVRQQLNAIENLAQDKGFQWRLLTALSSGGLVNLKYPRMYETLISGPIGGMLGAKHMADMLGIQNVVCCDLGGTSFDVGLITDGKLPINREPDYARFRLNLPMVATDSIGAGMGSVIHFDPATRRIDLGPESVGSDVGVCFRSQWPTVTDCNVVVGFLNPDNFLGGKVKLDKARAVAAIKEMADAVGQEVHQFAFGVIDLLNSVMREAMYGMLLAKGYHPADYHLFAYGGGGPVHLYGFSEDVPFGGIVTVPWAAAFSAYGLAMSEYAHRYHGPTYAYISSDADAHTKKEAGDNLNGGWATLEEKAYAEMADEGIPADKVSLRHFVYCRYKGQLDDFEVEVPLNRINNADDMDRVIGAFETAYERLFPQAMKFSEAGYLILEQCVQASSLLPRPGIAREPMGGKKPPRAAAKESREVYFRDKWVKADVWEMDALRPGNEIHGMAIIEHSMSTWVVPPGHYVCLDEYRFCWWHTENQGDAS